MKPSIPKGTRDFSPVEMSRRNYIFDTIRAAFKRYGYAPIETPAMENLSTLMGKYGEEGDRLIFKILNSGAVLEEIKEKSGNIKLSDISEKALRYDLTVPFARYVVQHQHEITFPFKRYQIQPVWRADRPQKGRYREFYQCDADVIGSNSLLYEIELVQLMDDVFTQLNLPVIIKINNRKILSGISEYIGHPEKMMDMTIAIDKLEKIGLDGVIEELTERAFGAKSIELLVALLKEMQSDDKLSPHEILNTIEKYIHFTKDGQKGIEEVRKVLSAFEEKLVLHNATLELDITLARGLNYYTGAIFEVKADVGEFKSSICGGGRYDDLTGIFGLPNMSGVGISFGADRIYDVLLEQHLFPEEISESCKALFVNFGDNESLFALQLISNLRAKNISCEIYPDAAKMKKQFEYADKKEIPYVIIIGEEEIKKNQASVKNMKDGSQQSMPIELLDNYLKEK